jgi:exodeoxyribonuclease VII small subunit
MSFSESMKQIESICRTLEEENLPLEEALKLYREGAEKLRGCREYLEQVEQEVLLVGENLAITPFGEERAQEEEKEEDLRG